MFLARFFRFSQRSRVPAPTVAPIAMRVEEMPVVKTALEHSYQLFLNIYVKNLLDSNLAEEAIHRAYSSKTLDLCRLLEPEHARSEIIELQASYLTEESRARARRHASEMEVKVKDVLVDQRNFLLAEHVTRLLAHYDKQRAVAMPAFPTPPAEAFYTKLTADSTLERGLAKYLDGRTLDALRKQIEDCALREMLPVLTLLSVCPVAMNPSLSDRMRSLTLDENLLRPILTKPTIAPPATAKTSSKNQPATPNDINNSYFE
jgi:hypothetical protein